MLRRVSFLFLFTILFTIFSYLIIILLSDETNLEYDECMKKKCGHPVSRRYYDECFKLNHPRCII